MRLHMHQPWTSSSKSSRRRGVRLANRGRFQEASRYFANPWIESMAREGPACPSDRHCVGKGRVGPRSTKHDSAEGYLEFETQGARARRRAGEARGLLPVSERLRITRRRARRRARPWARICDRSIASLAGPGGHTSDSAREGGRLTASLGGYEACLEASKCGHGDARLSVHLFVYF